MINRIASTLNWAPYYFAREIKRTLTGERWIKPKHVYFCICDHFEPYWNGADRKTARKRIQRWVDEYPKIADKFLDSDGQMLKYSFFYPEEEYREEDMNLLAELCHAGYGEVEIHLHHDNDTPENLRRALIDYKKRLHERHGLLSINKETGEISYGFIHGNWALCNSRRDGRWCGVNEEIKILLETGCYADFTMPSAPSDTQTRKVNSIYYAVDCPGRSKSHDRGVDADVGKKGEGLLMVQGPLALNWLQRKSGLVPRIENGGLIASNTIGRDRVRIWIDQGIHVGGAEDHVFVKVYTHGTQEKIMKMFFGDKALASLLVQLDSVSSEKGALLHFVSAREMANVIAALENGEKTNIGLMRNWRYQCSCEQVLKAEGA